MKRLLVLCDFCKPSLDTLDFSLDLRNQFGGKIFLLNVVELPVEYTTRSLPSLESKGPLLEGFSAPSENEFAKLKKSYAARSVEFTTVIEFGSITDKFVQFYPENNVNLILMGSGTVAAAAFFLSKPN